MGDREEQTVPLRAGLGAKGGEGSDMPMGFGAGVWTSVPSERARRMGTWTVNARLRVGLS